ncbi:class I adenylate-forming enzyme family protein [Nocardiopsis trehalosi]|uniref:AMP-binding protein n=1 Tax=Nocardiopsis trehalosi TaxID=109329 RepID=UPI0008367792|nr:AMP-binding protein [Nocardiopsis trehalosi]
MTERRPDPERLLGALGDPEATEHPWTVDWSAVPDAAALVRAALPARTAFHTSGSTGRRRRWERTADQLWAEAGLVADLVSADGRPDAVLAFAPPRHLYGTIATVLVPARLGVPVHYLPAGARLPDPGGRRWAVAAIPWTFGILLRRRAWFDGAARADFVHSTAVLPSAAFDLLDAVHARGRAGWLLELFGSTETGAVAVRRRRAGATRDPADPWTLCADVRFAGPAAGEAPLTVRSPRLALAEDGAPPPVWEMDDRVRVTGERTFTFAGRRGRLVNVNGRRLDLDRLEEELRSALDCADLACAPVADAFVGEHFDLLVVPGPGGGPSGTDLRAALDRLGCRPRRVRSVDRIDRSETGKLRHVQPEPDAPPVRGGQ